MFTIAGTPSAERSQRMRFDYPDQFRCVDGLTVRYWDQGRGEPLLLIHGMATCLETWAWNMPCLSASHRVIALDLPGAGKSCRPAGEDVFSLRYAGRFLAEFVNALGIETLAVVGNSMGGVLALQLALMRPALVKLLILVDSGGLGRQVHWGARLMTIPAVDHALAHLPRLLVRQIADLMLERDDADAEALADKIAEYIRVPGTIPAVQKMAEAGIGPLGQLALFSAADLGKVRAPTLVIWGEQDRVIPVKHARRALRAIPDCRAVVLAGAGHGPQIDRPDAFNEIVLEFLASSRLAGEDGFRQRPLRL